MKTTSLHIAAALCILVATGTLLFVALLPGACGARTRADLNVRSYGAKGNGKTDDTEAFIKALKDAVSSHRRLFVPAGVYRLQRLRLPDGLSLKGAGRKTSWLKGRLDFGSNQDISDLKIGPDSATDCAVHNSAGATNTVFEGCRFRGGGGEPGWVKSPVVSLGFNRSCSHITFRNCEVERNLGTESTRRFKNGYNDMSIDVNSGVTVSYITFDGCHVGVSNGATSGRTIGSPRMGLECWSDGSPGYPWSNITLTNCVFEAADSETADFSDAPACRSNGVLIEGSTFKGGGWARRMWGNVLNFEYPTGVVVRNNTIYRGWEDAVHMTTRDNEGYTGPAATFTGNTFDFVSNNGIKPASSDQVSLMGAGNVFTGNTITVATGHRAVQLDNCHYNTVTGNIIHCGALIAVGAINGSSNNTVRPNTVN